MSKVGVSVFPRTEYLAKPDMRKAWLHLATQPSVTSIYVLLRDTGAQSCNDLYREGCHCT